MMPAAPSLLCYGSFYFLLSSASGHLCKKSINPVSGESCGRWQQRYLYRLLALSTSGSAQLLAI
jgi:hypothetical protein